MGWKHRRGLKQNSEEQPAKEAKAEWQKGWQRLHGCISRREWLPCGAMSIKFTGFGNKHCFGGLMATGPRTEGPGVSGK
jgi:hypothetical protein